MLLLAATLAHAASSHPAAHPDPHARLCAELRSAKATGARVAALAAAGEPGRVCTFEDVTWVKDGHSSGWVIFGLMTAGVGFFFPDFGAHYSRVNETVELLPLDLAMHSGKPDIVAAIAATGVDLEVKLSSNETALAWAVGLGIESGNYAVARALLEHGASAGALDGTLYAYFAVAVATGPLGAELRAHGMPVELTDTMGWSVLYDAADAGNAAAVTTLLALGCNVNGADRSNSTPLFVAVDGGNTEVARLLLAAGADPNKSGAFSDLPLAAAVENADLPLVQLLLQHGALPNGPDHSDSSALYAAVRTANLPIVQALLGAGADPNCGSDVPLEAAIRAGRLDLADRLVAAGADPLRRLPFDETLVAVAARQDQGPALEWALAHGCPLRGAFRHPPLDIAAEYGATDAIRVLLAHGADPLDTQTTFGHPPLSTAIQHGQVEAASLLLSPLDPTQRATWLPILLHDAVASGSIGSAEFLLTQGTTLAAAFTTDDGPMHLAADREVWSMVDWLMKHRIPIDERDASGGTPLRAAIADGDRRSADELVARGASLATAGGPALYAIAANNDDERMIQWLEGHAVPGENVPGNAALAAAVTSDHEVAFQRLLNLGAHEDARLPDGGTLLHLSAATAGTPLLDTLLADHLDPNVLDNAGLTPLDRAILRRDTNTVEHLLAAGASPNQLPGAPLHPLQRAATSECEWCVQPLLDSGSRSEISILVPLTVSGIARRLDAANVPNTLVGTLDGAITTRNINAANLLLERGAVVTQAHLVQAVHADALELLPALLAKTGRPRGPDRKALLQEAKADGCRRMVRRILKDTD